MSFRRYFDPPIGCATFRVHSYGCSCTPGVHYEHRHPIEDTWLFCHFFDPVTIRVDGRLEEYPAQSWIYWKPGQWRGYGSALRRWRHSFLHLTGSRVEQTCMAEPARAGIPVMANAEAITERFLYELDSEVTNQLIPDTRILGNLFESWFLALRRLDASRDGRMPEPLALVRDKLMNGSAAWETLSELAAIAGMSRSHFSARFRESFGMSPGAFQTWWRIERAKGLLELPGMRICEVADKIGFADAFTFSRSFKSIAGVSPSQWRRIHVR